MQRINPRSDSYEALLWDIATNAHGYIPKVGDRVLDLGAHFGMFALYCASRGCRVVAYEPAKMAFGELLHTAAVAYEIDNGTIEAVNCAVWSHSGDSLLALDPQTTGANSMVRLEAHLLQPTPCCTLHDAMTHFLEIECAKFDIEGAEYEVLRTAAPEDLARIKYLTLELHNDILSRNQCGAVDTILRENFPHIKILPVKVQGQVTDQVSAYYCWR